VHLKATVSVHYTQDCYHPGILDRQLPDTYRSSQRKMYILLINLVGLVQSIWWLWSHEHRDSSQDSNRTCFEMHMEPIAMPVLRCTCRTKSSELRYACGGWCRVGTPHGGWNWVNSELHLEVIMVGIPRYAWWWRLYNFTDTVWSCYCMSIELHMKAVIEPVWQGTWRVRWRTFRDVP
jgi:hypothetical protein